LPVACFLGMLDTADLASVGVAGQDGLILWPWAALSAWCRCQACRRERSPFSAAFSAPGSCAGSAWGGARARCVGPITLR